MNNLFALQIRFADTCVEQKRAFPVSKHRSKRIHKKLVKRFGGETVCVPAIWYTPVGIIAHPSLMNEIERRFAGE